MSDVIGPLDGALIISEDKIPFTAYQAIYHKITRRVEVLSRFYKDAYRISFDDVKNLSYRLEQILAQYAVKGKRLQISHAVKDGFSSTYSSLEKFIRADMSQRECTSSFDFELDFLIVLPAEIPEAKDIAQRYKLTLNFQRAFSRSDDIFAPYFMEAFSTRSTFFMRLEYSDYAVAQSINATVQSWIDGLPKVEIGGVTKFLMKHEELATKQIGVVVGTIAPISSAIYLTTNRSSIITGFCLMLISFALAQITESVIGQVIENGYTVSRRVAADVEFILTQGDKDRIVNNSSDVSKVRKFLTFALCSIVIAIFVNLFSSWLYDYFSGK